MTAGASTTVLVAGEALIDLAPRDGLLEPLAGGSPYNVAVGLGRLGIPVGYLGTLSEDGFGRLLAARLQDAGVTLDLAPTTAAPTTLAVVHLDRAGQASYAFYLDGTSAVALDDTQLPDLPEGAAVHVSLGAVTLETAPSGLALRTLIERERGRRVISLDPNVRATMVADRDAYARRLDAVVAGVDLVKASDEDLDQLHPDDDPYEVASRWARSGPAVVVVTRDGKFKAAFDSFAHPSWMPDGRLLMDGAYFYCSFGQIMEGKRDRAGIYVTDAALTNATLLTTGLNGPNPIHPVASPDGNRIVFRSEREGGGLFVAPALG